MNEFAFENVVMHCLNPRGWPVWSAREVANNLTPRSVAKSRFCSTQWIRVFPQYLGDRLPDDDPDKSIGTAGRAGAAGS
jgi:hypothetical protein